MKFLKCLMILSMFSVAGCDTIAEKTNILSDEKIKSQAAGNLGYSPSDLTIISRRTDGTNTFVNVVTNDRKEFSCIINGGNLLTMGMSNPAACTPKGQASKASR
ncbi:hypothetical protein E2K99_07475 [Herbaspirillum huttiense]|uniref:hypothetical protein n=1 Tax=Herbaspirillum TaxID=963 RepID=UPI000C09246A|nr:MULTISPECIES: hypothetical protein [Herbaspirillum]MAF04982.1 hypothetical protein [Herbaspirillum sp.]MBO18530.1 hypothetical protein [Herbaspirillum sp.]QBP74869.1 hypothetical protein E2K99_07475 [Herbaspirillum huttiense]|tara:strand:- start:8351 stop:8662 length:312 start_codon:yes stop_codon:yes gene_type:complete